MSSNPNCVVVTGRPRTPRDQGSVESANKSVQRVLKSISSENRLQNSEVNWTKLLGQVMSVCNSHSNNRRHSVLSYEAVFGQTYHPALKCTMSDLRECWSIHQRLRMSPDNRLETYVRVHDIVDIEVPSALQQSGGYEGLEEMDESDDDEEEGDDIAENAFLDLDEECEDEKGLHQ
jgi:hypothetical protein